MYHDTDGYSVLLSVLIRLQPNLYFHKDVVLSFHYRNVFLISDSLFLIQKRMEKKKKKTNCP